MAQGPAKKIGLDHGDMVGLGDDDHAFYPKGVLAYAQVTSGQTGITSETNLTGLEVTISVDGTRRIKITGTVRVQSTSASGSVRLRIKEDGVGNIQESDFHPSTSVATLHIIETVVVPSSGSHTYRLSLNKFSGSGDVQTTGDATSRINRIFVEDIGPA